jgi:hypothetical protein
MGGQRRTSLTKRTRTGVEVVLTVTLFNKTELESLLNSESNRTTLINNLVNQVKSAMETGVNIDFEVFPASQKSNLVTFVKDLRAALRKDISHAQVTLATPAVDWSSAWDFNALASESDGLFIMGYDYHWKGSSTTGPVAPLKGGSYNITNTVILIFQLQGIMLEKLFWVVLIMGFNGPQALETKVPTQQTMVLQSFMLQLKQRPFLMGKYGIVILRHHGIDMRTRVGIRLGMMTVYPYQKNMI